LLSTGSYLEQNVCVKIIKQVLLLLTLDGELDNFRYFGNRKYPHMRLSHENLSDFFDKYTHAYNSSVG